MPGALEPHSDGEETRQVDLLVSAGRPPLSLGGGVEQFKLLAILDSLFVK